MKHGPAAALHLVNPVVTTNTNWFRINSIIAIPSGASQTNEGTITLRVSGGGNVRSKILPGISRSFNGFITVPAGKTLLLRTTQLLIPKNQDVVVRNRIMLNGTNTWLSGGDVSIYQNDSRADFTIMPTFPEKTDVEARVRSTNDNVTVSLNVEAILVNGTGIPMALNGF